MNKQREKINFSCNYIVSGIISPYPVSQAETTPQMPRQSKEEDVEQNSIGDSGINVEDIRTFDITKFEGISLDSDDDN